MEIERAGSRPSGKGSAEWFTGAVRIDPLFGPPDPARVAENLRRAIAGIGAHSSPLPMLTTTIGVASYPDDADNAPALIVAATQAAERRWSPGPDATATPPGRDSTQVGAGCFVGRREG